MPDREVLVITGLPRSGTTLLHNLLAVDSSNFFVPLWRALYPCPVEADSNDRRARVQAAELQLRFADRLSPSLRRIHPMYPEWPEECITLMQLSGLSDRYTICLRVPSYAAWLSRQAMDEPYRLLRSVVDAIEPTGMRTVLKAPSHLGNVREIRKVWPRSRFLTIRRSPDAAVISFCRLVEASRMVFSSLVDRKEIGPEWCEVWAERARVQMPGGSITLEYSDLVKGPTDVVRDVYQEMGWSFSNDVRSKVADWATRHPAPTGAPTTAAQAYGLERSMILRGFSGSTYT